MSGALPIPSDAFGRLALAVFAATVVFNVATYNHFRGSVITPLHGGPISPGKHHISLTDAVLLPNGTVRFHAYLDGGSPAAPSNVITAALRSNDGTMIEQWDGTGLSCLPTSAIINEFAYNRFAPGPFGLRALVGAMATITLPSTGAAGIGGSMASRRCSYAPSTAISSASPSDRVEERAGHVAPPFSGRTAHVDLRRSYIAMLEWNNYRQQLTVRIGEIAKLSPETIRGYRMLSAAGQKTNLLGPKTRELISLAVAVRCDDCITVHAEAAARHGASREEIAEALGVATAVNAGAALVHSARVLDAYQQTTAASCTADQ
jgi:AhpD family alkylhydroperoxidase